MFGFININKQTGITSHKIISLLRSITGIKQIGHGGTLDPLASGVLPVAIGKAAKLIDFLPEDKSYKAGIYLGKVSDTFDIEGEVKETGYRKITKNEVISVLEQFRGEIVQIPPIYSAIHYNGKRLYELAREGKIPDDIPARKVNIYKNEIIDFDYENQILKLEINCSKGTYIRSIVNDIGSLLKSGGVMYELIRTKSSGMCIENSITIDNETTREQIQSSIINPVELIDMPKLETNENIYKKIITGNKFKNTTPYIGNVLLTKNNSIVAYATADSEYIQPKKVLI